MSKSIFINAIHPHHTRIAILKDGKLDEILVEGLEEKSNIYLGTITRIENSLQACFVDYGSEKSGFLPFSEIHPDYYQLSASERAKLNSLIKSDQENWQSHNENEKEDDEDEEGAHGFNGDDRKPNQYEYYKKYKIQDVIKRKQKVLVQVYKSRRGNKGVSLTTYISLAGRNCVFMPNTPNSVGGISRRIKGFEERKRIEEIVKKLNIPYGMGLIIRTAGEGASEESFKKDYESLVELWNYIRNTTLKSEQKTLIYAENNIVKQTIRDLYSEDVTEIYVEGKKAYEDVLKCFNTFGLKNEGNKVILYDDKIPLFVKYNIESQIESLIHNRVELPSGGYIIINQTEALVAIDVNSGKATAEKNIEDTALKMNVEAAWEIARQIRLRDLGGLIVIDFIDMEDGRNRRYVEQQTRQAFYNDRAKVQFARISIFGLLEISRQRIRSSILDANTLPCTMCNGSGKVKSSDFIAKSIANTLHRALSRHDNKYKVVIISASSYVCNIVLNVSYALIEESEKQYKIKIITRENDRMIADQYTLYGKENEDDTTENVILEYTGNPIALGIINTTVENENYAAANNEYPGREREKRMIFKSSRSLNASRRHGQERSDASSDDKNDTNYDRNRRNRGRDRTFHRSESGNKDYKSYRINNKKGPYKPNNKKPPNIITKGFFGKIMEKLLGK